MIELLLLCFIAGLSLGAYITWRICRKVFYKEIKRLIDYYCQLALEWRELEQLDAQEQATTPVRSS